MAPYQVSAPALRKSLDALFFRPTEQLVLRLKSPAAVRPVAVEGQVQFQAVGQKLDATHVACGRCGASRARWGCQCSGAWDQGALAICGDARLQLLEPDNMSDRLTIVETSSCIETHATRWAMPPALSRFTTMRWQSRIRKEPVMEERTAYVGLDVHKTVITMALLRPGTRAPLRIRI